MEKDSTPEPLSQVVPPALPPMPQEAAGPRAAEQWVTGAFIFVLLLLILVVLALASVPFITSTDGGGSTSSEGRAALGAMKDRARVVYQRTGKAPTMADLEISPAELEGSYFSYANYSCGGEVKHWWAKCTGVYSQSPTDLILTADLETGSSTYNR